MLISRLRRELFLSGGSMVRSRCVSVGEEGDSVGRAYGGEGK